MQNYEKKYPNVRWDEIMRIACSQIVVTAEVETTDECHPGNSHK